jgi:lipopolysaccharide biosynthesis glycosyltransferase
MGEMIENAAILHFVESIKPWNDATYPEREKWMDYFEKSVCSDEKLSYIKCPSPARKWSIKLASMFILNKKKRRKFREKIWLSERLWVEKGYRVIVLLFAFLVANGMYPRFAIWYVHNPITEALISWRTGSKRKSKEK